MSWLIKDMRHLSGPILTVDNANRVYTESLAGLGNPYKQILPIILEWLKRVNPLFKMGLSNSELDEIRRKISDNRESLIKDLDSDDEIDDIIVEPEREKTKLEDLTCPDYSKVYKKVVRRERDKHYFICLDEDSIPGSASYVTNESFFGTTYHIVKKELPKNYKEF